MKKSDALEDVLKKSSELVKNFQHEYETTEHLLKALLGKSNIMLLFRYCRISSKNIETELLKYFNILEKITDGNNIPIKTIGYKSVIRNATNECQKLNKDKVDVTDLLLSLYDEKRSRSSFILRNEGLSRTCLLNAISAISTQYKDTYENNITINNKNIIDLTALAKQGKLDPVVGREKETERTLFTLCRRNKNNPILIGDAGVGKTAIVEGVAQQIINKGNVPNKLLGYKIYSLNIVSLMAGTRYRGALETKLNSIFKEISNKKIILFIDEIHCIVGMGAVSSSALDVANILKPLLSSGQLHCIGATTIEEYKKYFEKDKALSRRFQKIEIKEPSKEDAITILNKIKPKYEQYHNVIYTYEALEAAVFLSDRYINDRFLPDKAIDVIDEAGAYAGNENIIVPVKIGKIQIENTISKMAKIPELVVFDDEKDILLNLEQELKKKIFGQDKAIEEVVNAVKLSRAGFRIENKPVANFLFAGPTGVGKTELACQLAKQLSIPVIRFDMSEFQEKSDVSRLIGTTAGYVGYEDGGQLTDAIRKQPYSVLLLDEIEKAHKDVFNILLQIMDYAVLTDGHGLKADFRNVIIIMTSNAGAKEIGKSYIGFGDRKADRSAVDDAVCNIFSPEFRNRLDSIIHFGHLTKEIMISVVQKELKQFAAQLTEKKIYFEFSDVCINKIAEECYSFEFGARNANRFIERKIKNYFVDEFLFGRLNKGGNVFIDWKDGDYYIDIQKNRIKKQKLCVEITNDIEIQCT